MVATHIKKIKHGMLCITGVYLRDITYTIFIVLHLSMSCLSICSFCVFFQYSCGDLQHRNTGAKSERWSQPVTLVLFLIAMPTEHVLKEG